MKKKIKIIPINIGGENISTSKKFFDDLLIEELQVFVGDGAGIAKNLKQTQYGIENLFKKPDPFREKFMSLPKGEQSTIMSYGYPRYMEGGIASLNVKK